MAENEGLRPADKDEEFPRYRVVFKDNTHDRIVEGIGTFIAEDDETYTFSWQCDPSYESFVMKDDVLEIWSTSRPQQIPHVWGSETRML